MTPSPSAAATPAPGGHALRRLLQALESTVLGQPHVVADLAGHHRRHHARAAASLLRGGHAEPAGAGGHLPAARGPARPLPEAGARGLPAARGRYGRAYDFAFARSSRRSLVVLFTDLVDPDASGTLLARTLALRPRHLPLVASLLDPELQAAARLEEDYQRTALTLRDSGALVVRAPAKGFGAAAVNTYLHVKARGLL